MTKGIKSLDRRSQRAFMQSKWRVIVPVFGDAPHPAGNRATRRAALKAQRTKARQRSYKRQATGAMVDSRQVVRPHRFIEKLVAMFGGMIAR